MLLLHSQEEKRRRVRKRREMKSKVKKKRVRRMKLKKVKKRKKKKRQKKKVKIKNRFLAVYAKHMSYFPANKTFLPLIHSAPPVAEKSPLILQITPNHLSVCVAFRV